MTVLITAAVIIGIPYLVRWSPKFWFPLLLVRLACSVVLTIHLWREFKSSLSFSDYVDMCASIVILLWALFPLAISAHGLWVNRRHVRHEKKA